MQPRFEQLQQWRLKKQKESATSNRHTSYSRPAFQNRTSCITNFESTRSSVFGTNLGSNKASKKENREPFMSNSPSPFRGRYTQTPSKDNFGLLKNGVGATSNLSQQKAQRPTSFKPKSPYKCVHTPQQQAKIKVFDELKVIFREFQKTQAAINSKSKVKMQNVDPDKWRKKFKFLFDREKVLNFDAQESSYLFAKKGIITKLEPVATKQLGTEIMNESEHFWVLFTFYNKPKIENDIDNREKVRRQIVDNLFEKKFSDEDHKKQDLLKTWLDNMLYLPDLTVETYSQNFESSIKQNLKEIQQEEEIIFFDDFKHCAAFQGVEQDITFDQKVAGGFEPDFFGQVLIAPQQNPDVEMESPEIEAKERKIELVEAMIPQLIEYKISDLLIDFLPVPSVLEAEIIYWQNATSIEYLQPQQPLEAALINLSNEEEIEKAQKQTAQLEIIQYSAISHQFYVNVAPRVCPMEPIDICWRNEQVEGTVPRILSMETQEIAWSNEQVILTGNPDNLEPINESIGYSNECVNYYKQSYLAEVLENSFVYQFGEVFEQKLPAIEERCLVVLEYRSATYYAEMLPVLQDCETVVLTAKNTLDAVSLPKVKSSECHQIQFRRDFQTESLPKLETVSHPVEQHGEYHQEFQLPAKKLGSKREPEKVLNEKIYTRGMKRQKVEEEVCQNLDDELDQIEQQGASCLKYEIVRKGQKNMLLAKRCSLRHQCIGLDEQAPLEADMSFEYQPSALEKMFQPDQKAERVKMKAFSKKTDLEVGDIKEIIGVLDSKKQLILVEIESSLPKFRSVESKLAAYIGKTAHFAEFTQLNEGKYLKFPIVLASQKTKAYLKQNV